MLPKSASLGRLGSLLRLEVTVNDVSLVHETDGIDHLRRVISRGRDI